MIRTCPICGDFYADDSLRFCPMDGTPLADLDPHGEAWADGARVVEEKERTLRRQTRRLKLRRVLMTTTTVLITTLVVCVVVVNTYIYLAPQPDAPVVVAAVTPQSSPKPSETPAWTPSPDSPSTLPFVPAVTPTPTPSPTPTLTATPTHTHTPPPPPQCTADDRQRLGDSIVATHDAEWRDAIESEKTDILRANVPAGSPARRVEVGNGKAVLGTVTYAPTVAESCADASVTARYEWQVTWDVFFNGKSKPESKTVPGTKTFRCSKGGAAWRCG
jgi:hypothetical protein